MFDSKALHLLLLILLQSRMFRLFKGVSKSRILLVATTTSAAAVATTVLFSKREHLRWFQLPRFLSISVAHSATAKPSSNSNTVTGSEKPFIVIAAADALFDQVFRNAFFIADIRIPIQRCFSLAKCKYRVRVRCQRCMLC
jgi:hypothetical protein